MLLMEIETLRSMELAPGMVRKNIMTEGLEVNALRVGQELGVGKVELAVSTICEPCEQLEKLRTGLEEAMVGKASVACCAGCYAGAW